MQPHKLSLSSLSFTPSQPSSLFDDDEIKPNKKKDSDIKDPIATLPENHNKKKKKKKNPDYIKGLGEWNFPLSSNFREKLKKEKEEEELQKKIEKEKPKKYDFLKKIGQELSKISKPAVKPNKIIKYKALGVGNQELVLKNSKRMTKLKRNLLKYQQDQLKILGKKKESDEIEIVESEEEEKKESLQNNGSEPHNKNQSFILNSLKTPIKTRPHPQIIYKSMKIRDWVDHMLCEEIDLSVMKLINILNFTQMVKKIKEPKKFKKRIVAGLKETLRTLETSLTDKQSKCIILAINIQEDPYPEGIDQKIIQILSKAVERNVLIVHSCSRRKLGMAYSGKVGPKIGVVSIVNFQNYEESFIELKELVFKRRIDYLNYFNQIKM